MSARWASSIEGAAAETEEEEEDDEDGEEEEEGLADLGAASARPPTAPTAASC